MAKVVSPTACSTANVTMRVRKSPSGGRPPPPPPPTSATCPVAPLDAPGLPPLPKSLSSLLNANSGTWRETLRIQTHKNMIQDSLASGPGPAPPGSASEADNCPSAVSSSSSTSSSSSSNVSSGTARPGAMAGKPPPPPKRRKPRKVTVPQGNLDGALAMLRKEMVGLRQLDMSLLSQLWSLHESIQEYKVVVETMSCMSDRDSADFDSEDLQSLSPLSPGIVSPTSMV